MAAKLKNENGLSAYGAVRKSPAGEIMWSDAATNEVILHLGEAAVSRLTSLYSTSTESR